MSRVFSKNKKELAGTKVVPAKDVWIYNPSTGKTDKLNPDLDIFGKVDLTSVSNFVLKANRKGNKTEFVEDVSVLPNRTKNELVQHFHDKNGERNKKTVAYIIRTDTKSKTKK